MRARPEIVDQLQALEHPLDLAAVITGEREALGAVAADQVSSLESAMFSTVLTAVNTSLTEESAPRMHVTSFDGLRQSLTDARVLRTGAR